MGGVLLGTSASPWRRGKAGKGCRVLQQLPWGSPLCRRELAFQSTPSPPPAKPGFLTEQESRDSGAMLKVEVWGGFQE